MVGTLLSMHNQDWWTVRVCEHGSCTPAANLLCNQLPLPCRWEWQVVVATSNRWFVCELWKHLLLREFVVCDSDIVLCSFPMQYVQIAVTCNKQVWFKLPWSSYQSLAPERLFVCRLCCSICNLLRARHRQRLNRHLALSCYHLSPRQGCWWSYHYASPTYRPCMSKSP